MKLNSIWCRYKERRDFEQELYPHIGYGFLDRKSIRREGETLYADYLMDGKKVLEVSKDGDYYQLNEFFDSRYLRSSHRYSLDSVIKDAYAAKDEFSSARFQYLNEEYLEPNDIYCDPEPGKADFDTVFVPDGLKIGLEIIETPENRRALYRFRRSREEGSPVEVLSNRRILILVLNHDGEVTFETKRLVKIGMPVAYIPITIPQMANTGILTERPDKYRARACILYNQMKEEKTIRFRLYDSQEEVMCMWVKKPRRVSDPRQLERHFRISAMAYLEAERHPN
jgi:hypothetical protein